MNGEMHAGGYSNHSSEIILNPKRQPRVFPKPSANSTRQKHMTVSDTNSPTTLVHTIEQHLEAKVMGTISSQDQLVVEISLIPPKF